MPRCRRATYEAPLAGLPMYDTSQMPKTFQRRLRCIQAVSLLLAVGSASGAWGDGFSSYGTPGLIDIPSATTSGDGTLSWTTSHLSGHTRNSLHFQITPRLSGVFRYSILNGFFTGSSDPDLFDRSFDLHYQLLDETPATPALAFGLRDFGGTGIFESEYLVASKHFLKNRLTLTGGIGWGRLGSYGGFRNPLSTIDDRFGARPGSRGITDTGRVSFNRLFRGDAAFFGGLEYQATERLRFALEYSSDAYEQEVTRMGFEHRTPLNIGLTYKATDNLTLNTFLLGGAQAGFGFTYMVDPRRPRFPGGIERNTPALVPMSEIAALGWASDDISKNRARLKRALSAQGLSLESYDQSGSTARIVLSNSSYPATPEAIGRAGREMSNSLPAGIDTFEITLAADGMPTTRTRLRRSDLQELEHAWDGSWQSFVRADIADAPSRLPPDPGVYPKLDWSVLPYFRPAFFDPDSPLRLDAGVEGAAHFALSPSLSFTAVVRQRAVGNLDQSTRASNSELPHVRSDSALYDKLAGPHVDILTADYQFRPGPNLYARLSAGYLEPMYGGVSGELLWYPASSRLALGAELNYVAQRDPASRLGFTDYRVATGHLSAYYDLGDGYRTQLDVGRYLAGDWGATFALDREFDNGFKVGAYFTLTDVPLSTFGEGSFDKGIRFSIPISWLSGEPGHSSFQQTIRPILRDGGARIEVANRLYEQVRGANASELEHKWGKFWR